jgi:hypothetical protein
MTAESIAESVNGANEDTIAALTLIHDYVELELKVKEEAQKLGIPEKVIHKEIERRQSKGNGKATDEREKEEEKAKTKQADILIGLAEQATLFHTPDVTCYADIEVKGHRETWPIRSRGFRRWLSHAYYETTDGAPSSEAIQSALNVLEARAHFDADQSEVHVRVAGAGGKIYLDLADDAWRCIEIDARGWRIVATPPVRFRRAPGTMPLPIPVKGGDIGKLKPYLNVVGSDEFNLAVGWALAALRHVGPYPVLVLQGGEGTAKSTFSSIMRHLVDPNTAPLRAMPREIRDLCIAAHNSHVLAFDNVSDMRPWISDALCRMSTGGGFATRMLHSDMDEVLFDATRPIILNGIESVVTRPDLADRSVNLGLIRLGDDARKPEDELWAAFHNDSPAILGGLLDAVSRGLKDLPNVNLTSLPRMADFAKWGQACEVDKGAFMRAYNSNRAEVVESVIEADLVATAIRDFMADKENWKGSLATLLTLLSGQVGDKVADHRDWPTSARGLSGALTRVSASLLRVGILYLPPDRSKKDRAVALEKRPPQQAPQAPPAPMAENKGFPGAGLGAGPTLDCSQPAPHTGTNNSLINKGGADGADGAGLGGSFSVVVCAHCGGESDIGNAVETWPGEDVPLHAFCRPDWHEARRIDYPDMPECLRRSKE